MTEPEVSEFPIVVATFAVCNEATYGSMHEIYCLFGNYSYCFVHWKVRIVNSLGGITYVEQKYFKLFPTLYVI